MIYKISYVIQGGDYTGAILNSKSAPKIGDPVHLGDGDYEVVDVFDLMPPRGKFHYLHVTCKPISSS